MKLHSSPKKIKSKPEQLPSIVIQQVLTRYVGSADQTLNKISNQKKDGNLPKNLDLQLSIKIDAIMELDIEAMEEIEKELQKIRDDNNEFEQSIRDEEERIKREKAEEENKIEEKRKIALSYWSYTRYLQTWQYQSAMKHFRANSDWVIYWYVSFMSTENLVDYIIKLATTICTKSTIKKMPKAYGEHLFVETLPKILMMRGDVVQASQEYIEHIAQFYPIWEQFILPETETVEV